MGRSNKDLRNTLAQSQGIPKDDATLLQKAVPLQAPPSIAQTVHQRTQQLRAGIPTRRPQ